MQKIQIKLYTRYLGFKVGVGTRLYVCTFIRTKCDSAWSRKAGFCSTRSTCENNGSRRPRDTRPIPAPQSAGAKIPSKISHAPRDSTPQYILIADMRGSKLRLSYNHILKILKLFRANTGPIGHSVSISLWEFIWDLILGVIIYYTVSASFVCFL